MAIDTKLQQALAAAVKGRISFNEPMCEHTTIRIGGVADAWFEPADLDELLSVVAFLDKNEMPKMIFGNGSNTLVRDKGIRGFVISLAKFDLLEQRDNLVRAGAGLLLQRLLGFCVEQSLSGLECIAGIPGTVGGAVVMNAGTKDGTIGPSVESLKLLNKGKIVTIAKGDLGFSYRKLKLPKNAIIVEVILSLKPDVKGNIETRIGKIKKHRGDVQPLIWPSLGSVFKNPDGGPKAWQLIDDCGLRGVRVGGARVSNEHANWIVNEGNATAKDVEVLIKIIRERVKEKSEILLEPEIMIIGE